MPSAPLRPLLFAFAILCLLLAAPLHAADDPAIFPLDQVKPGMSGVAYTIFDGDQIEKIDLQVIGVMNNALGPKQDIILVKLLGDKAAEDGVVAGMSGSPVYFDGKLAGALSLKLGSFTKDAIAGVTPIEDMLKVEHFPATVPSSEAAGADPSRQAINSAHVAVPTGFVEPTAAGTAGQFLIPIETPLIASGLYPATIARFSKEFASWGMTVMAGGTAPPSPADAQLKPGDMVGIDLIRGDLSLASGCTVTTVVANQILACGHPLFGFGDVKMPLSRAHVLMTLASSNASTKVMTTGEVIGTLTQDRQTAISGTLGAGPPMIPVDMTLDTPDGENKYHFEVVESPQLTAVLVATAAFNGIVGSPIYGEGTTLQLDGDIDLNGHTPVHLANLFAPTDPTVPAGFFLATEVQSDFAQIYSNPYELPQIKRVDLHVRALPERRWAVIDNAWAEKSEVQPGETVNVKVLLRPYRGASFLREIPVTIPAQTPHGTLELVVSDAAFLNRNVQTLASTSQGQLPGLEELITLMNRERRNDRVYATLLQPTPTMLVEDKEMPNVPVSAIDILDRRENTGNARLLWESTIGESSIEMNQVIAGERMLTITVK